MMIRVESDRATDAGASESGGLSRGLSSRQIQLMAIGGAIGVGLFLGAGKAISEAGPAVLLAYLLAGAVAFLMLRALGEMAMERPISGSFARYSGAFVGPWAEYATGWTYWAMWITTVMAEITAIGIYVRYWVPGMPQWIPALVAVIVLLGANLISVRVFGELEFWFALIKIVAILAFVVSGIAIVLFGLGRLGHQASASNLWSHGGFFGKGVLGPLVALEIVTYAFLGIEMIGVTAGEARNPQRELPKAINRVAWRILLFYVGAIAVILMLIPWTHVSLTQSPFVLAWSSLGIAGAAGILNAVVLTSALSSSNSGIFASARMLHSLSGSGHAPRALRSVSKRRVPARALAVCGVALMAGVVLNVVIPASAFADITSIATVAVLWVWGMIVVAHLRFREQVRQGLRARQSFRLPGSPWTNYAVLAFIALVAVLLAVKSDQRVALAAGAVWTLALAIGWYKTQRNPAVPTEASDGPRRDRA
jgi:AAT family amino acid transporter/D-serine/D-alanine/glycine transporter